MNKFTPVELDFEQANDLLADLIWWFKGFLTALEMGDLPLSNVGINQTHFEQLQKLKLYLLYELQEQEEKQKKARSDYWDEREHYIASLEERLEELEEDHRLETKEEGSKNE